MTIGHYENCGIHLTVCVSPQMCEMKARIAELEALDRAHEARIAGLNANCAKLERELLESEAACAKVREAANDMLTVTVRTRCGDSEMMDAWHALEAAVAEARKERT